MATNRRSALSQSQNVVGGGGNETVSAASVKFGRGINTRTPDRARAGKGVRPLPDPYTFKQVGLMLILHVCRRILFCNTHAKVFFYMIALLFGSLLCDFFPLPRGYFSKKNNFLNVYFVKLGWGWTLITVGLFVLLSSYVYCCGDKQRVRKHLSRLFISTILWYVWISVFGYIESAVGICRPTDKTLSKAACLKTSNRWYGFDISGHAFLLIFCNLIIMEEVKCMRGWERISEFIRYDEYDEDNPLHILEDDELSKLKIAYTYLGPYVKLMFIAVTLLSILWDIMLINTILYFHSMTQKLVGGLIAVLSWYVTYRLWFKQAFPGLPGEGPFKYSDAPPAVGRGRQRQTRTEN